MAAALRSAIAADADRIAQILIDVRSVFMAYAPLTHSDAEVRSWVTSYLLPAGETVVAQWDGMVVGVMTTEQDVSCSWITQMAVDPPCVGIGIGSLLLQHAFRKCRLPIRLFTFQANSGARRFYERHGFRPILLSDGQANEERCPDVLYEFTGVGAPRFTTPDRT
jgi:GNAT superfamily N-acetyltransferase